MTVPGELKARRGLIVSIVDQSAAKFLFLFLFLNVKLRNFKWKQGLALRCLLKSGMPDIYTLLFKSQLPGTRQVQS